MVQVATIHELPLLVPALLRATARVATSIEIVGSERYYALKSIDLSFLIGLKFYCMLPEELNNHFKEAFMKRFLILFLSMVTILSLSFKRAEAQEAGELGIKLQSIKFEDISDSKAYASVFGYINTTPNAAIGFEIGTVNEKSIDFTPIEVNLKFRAKSRGETGFALNLGGGVSYNVLNKLYVNDVKVVDENKNLFGWQAFVSGKYFFTPPRASFGIFAGAEIKYQWVDSFTEYGEEVDLSNTRFGLEVGVMF